MLLALVGGLDGQLHAERVVQQRVAARPSVGTDGKFKFDVEVKSGEKIAIDPVVAIGYDYEIGSGDPLFSGFILPTIGDNSYELNLWGGAAQPLLGGVWIPAFAGMTYGALSSRRKPGSS